MMDRGASLELREMVASDVPAMASLEAGVSPQPWSEALFAGELEVSAALRFWLIALNNSSVVGFGGVMFVVEDDRMTEGHIMNMAVAPEARRRGIGARLLHGLIGEAQARAVESLTLEVRADNSAALGLYSQYGFAPAGIRKGYYPDGSAKAEGVAPGATGLARDAVVMWLHDLCSSEYNQRLKKLAVGL